MWNTKRIRQCTVLIGITAPLLLQCSMLGSLPGPAGDAARVAKGCPDISSIDAIAKIDFADEFAFDPAVGLKVKAGVIAAADLTALAASIDADLKGACSGLAKDLGTTADFKSGKEACQAAIKAMADTKAKMGAKATVAVNVDAPRCSLSMGAVADCAGKCDANLKGGKAEVKCEGGELSGACDGDCSGSCELSAAAACTGTCSGSCDAGFSGTCNGTCEGKCNGKDSKGTCSGKCEGTCDTGASGSCSGNCGGSCELKGSAKCEGTCSGECSVEFKEPKCSGQLVAPSISPECKASCDAHASAEMSCTPPAVSVKITGSADAEAAARYKAALEANLPRIVKVAIGMAPKLKDILIAGKTTIEGGITAGQAVVSGRPTAAVHVTTCLLEPFAGSIAALANIQASVSVSLDVKASASASASGSGKAG